jgi:DNA-binding response OmpR family regulator
MDQSPRALVVEDEPHIRDLVCLHLGLEGFDCTPTGDGREALRLANEQVFELIVLDLMLPGLDGVTLCRAVRRQGPSRDAAILMLTARREESDKVLGLESGADDYLTKPFGVRELVARVHALRRRLPGSERIPVFGRGEAGVPSGRIIRTPEIEVDPLRRRVRLEGRDIELTTQEFTLLATLAAHPGIVFAREALLQRVWKGETHVTDRSVDTLIKRVRRKIEPDPANPRFILTVWGAGYKFADRTEDETSAGQRNPGGT